MSNIYLQDDSHMSLGEEVRIAEVTILSELNTSDLSFGAPQSCPNISVCGLFPLLGVPIGQYIVTSQDHSDQNVNNENRSSVELGDSSLPTATVVGNIASFLYDDNQEEEEKNTDETENEDV
jgi:hypothetical protein